MAEHVGIGEKTVGNVVRDLVNFGIVNRKHSEVKLESMIQDVSSPKMMIQLRKIFNNHALTIELRKLGEGKFVSDADIIRILKSLNPAAQHREATWKVYADRMTLWLTATGYLVSALNGWKVEDQGHIVEEVKPFSRRRRNYEEKYGEEGDVVFFADASPEQTIDTIKFLLDNPECPLEKIKSTGFHNGWRTLVNLQIAHTLNGTCSLNQNVISFKKTVSELVWQAGLKMSTLSLVIEHLKSKPTISNAMLGDYVSKHYNRDWSEISANKIGGRLIKWAVWLSQNTDDRGRFLHKGLGSNDQINKQTDFLETSTDIS